MATLINIPDDIFILILENLPLDGIIALMFCNKCIRPKLIKVGFLRTSCKCKWYCFYSNRYADAVGDKIGSSSQIMFGEFTICEPPFTMRLKLSPTLTNEFCVIGKDKQNADQTSPITQENKSTQEIINLAEQTHDSKY